MFYGYRIKRNHKNMSKILDILVFDTETQTMQIDAPFKTYDKRVYQQVFYVGFAIFFRYNTETQKIIFEKKCLFYDIQKFWNFLFERFEKTRNNILYVFAHNMGFDFFVTELDKFLLHYNFEIKTAIMDNRNFIVKAKKHKNKILFLSTTNYFKFSLSKIGKMLGLEKLSFDYTKVGSKDKEDELIQYLVRDTEILKKLVIYYINFLKIHDLGKLDVSIASQSFRAFRHRFLRTDVFIHKNKKAELLEIESYRGGRTEVFYIGKVKNVVYLDINSLYPYMMKKYKYPVKLVQFEQKGSVELLHYLLKREDLGFIARVKIEVNEPLVGIRDKKTKKLIFPIGKFWVVLTSPEIKFIIECGGNILEVKEIAIYKMEKIFEEYVDFFYELKKRYTIENNKIMRTIAKLFMNSLYGKFGQRTEKFEEKQKNEKDKVFRIVRYYDADNGEWNYDIDLGCKKYVKKRKEYKKFYYGFIAIASFVTAYARTELTRWIRKVGWENVYYCDTDSMVVKKQFVSKVRISNELGDWKIEHEGDIEIRGAKNYTFYESSGEKIEKIKGITKKSEKIGKNEFVNRHFASPKRVLMFRILGVFYYFVKKKLRQEYDKGIITKDGRVKPFVLNE